MLKTVNFVIHSFFQDSFMNQKFSRTAFICKIYVCNNINVFTLTVIFTEVFINSFISFFLFIIIIII